MVGIAPAQAKSKAPCWKTLINDWYDGRIDGTYPVPCYRAALKHLPSDVDAYSSARDDIKQALQIRLTQRVGNKGNRTSPTTPNNEQTTTDEDGANQSSGPPGSNQGGDGPNSGPGGDRSTKGRDTNGPIPGAGGPDSVPIPLIVLGSIAALLMAAGAAGFITRRARARRLQLASAAAVAQRSGDSPPAE
jgi:hypothetical protein